MKNNKLYYPPGGILIWIIIFLELITFGIALVAMVYQSTSESELFHLSKLELNTTIGMINTLVLLSSGYFMAKSVELAENSNIRKTNHFLNLTLLFGFIFLILKTIEYLDKIEHGFVMGYNSFFNYYWMLTFFHVIHIVVGIIILSSFKITIRKKGKLSLEDYKSSAAFWHMCDLIWLMIFPVIYLVF